MRSLKLVSAAALAASLSLPALAATCEHPQGFDAFMTEFKRDAAAAGVSARALSALNGMQPDPSVIQADRRQGVFKQSFEQFGPPRIASRMAKAERMMREHAPTLQRAEKQFGVPAGIIIAIWGLESDFGINLGKRETLRALVTLAHDCRRTDLFQRELTEALKIVDRGDLTPAQMRGDWAGELGQAHFLPSSYNKYAIDFDGDGKRDLFRSTTDVLGSVGNYLMGYGWQRGQRWNEGTANFEVIRQWNKALVVAKTIALFGEQLEGRSARAEQPRR